MALSAATITYDLSDYGLADFDSRRTKVWATNNVNGPVIDTEGNTIHLGSANGTVNTDGTGSITVPTPGTGSNPASWQTTIHVDYPDRNADRGRGRLSLGPFAITVSANLADLVDEQAIPPDYAGELVATVEAGATAAAASATSAAASADAAATIVGLTGEDAAVAFLVEDAGSDTSAALSATIGTAVDPKADRSGVRFIPAGDSLSDPVFTTGVWTPWPILAQGYTDGRMQLDRFAGVGGNTSAQLLARLDADVIAHDPDMVSVWIGTNDVSGSIPDATFYANVTAIHDALREAGVTSVVCTIPPRTDTTKHATIAKWNAWLKRFAAETRRPLWDFHAALVDPADGTHADALTNDGVHLSADGHHTIAAYVADRVAELAVPGALVRSTYNTDPRTLVSNGFLINESLPWATGWVPVGGASGTFTETLVDDPDFAGQAWEVAYDTTANGARQISQNVATGFAAGDRMRFHARVKVTASSGLLQGDGASIVAVFNGATSDAVQYLASGMQSVGLNGLIVADTTVPAGTSSIDFIVGFNVGGTARPFTVRVGELGLLNMSLAP